MFDWLPWLMGGSTIALLVVAVLAPSVLTVAASWLSALSPLVKAAAEGLVAFWNILWTGLKDIIDSWKTVVTTVVIVLLSVWYFQKPVDPCPVCPTVVCKKGETVSKTYKPSKPSVSNGEEDVLTTMRRALGL